MEKSSTATARSGSLRALLGRRGAARTRRRGLDGRGLALPLGLLGRGVPVVDHLEGKDRVEDEARNEAVQDQLVVDLLESGEDARQGTGEVVEDLIACLTWDFGGTYLGKTFVGRHSQQKH